MAIKGSQIVQEAMKYRGSPYSWGGWLPSGWDCSGCVGYVLGFRLGLALPGITNYQAKFHGPVAAQYKVWGGAVTVSSPEPGDLCCWLTHIGIAVGGGKMISALDPKYGTAVTPISYGPSGESVSYRRLKSSVTSSGGFPTASTISITSTGGCVPTMLMAPALIPLALLRRRK